nr:hypothetical protein Itr_chr01CG24120 [Ipomoea trifida]
MPVPDGPKPLLMPPPREPPVGVVTIGEPVEDVDVDGSPVEGVVLCWELTRVRGGDRGSAGKVTCPSSLAPFLEIAVDCIVAVSSH